MSIELGPRVSINAAHVCFNGSLSAYFREGFVIEGANESQGPNSIGYWKLYWIFHWLFLLSFAALWDIMQNSIEISVEYSIEFSISNWIEPKVFLDPLSPFRVDVTCGRPLSSSGQGFQLWSLPRRRPLRPQTEAPRRGSFIDHLYLSWAVWTSELWMSTKLTQNWFYSDGTEKNGTLASKSMSLGGECSWTDGKRMWFTKSDKRTVHWFPVISSILYNRLFQK